LQELRHKPLNLRVDSLSLIAEWEQPREILVNENFEGGVFPPNGWQALTQNFTGWYATTDGSSENFTYPFNIPLMRLSTTMKITEMVAAIT
jgi:hypothetical protein